MVESAAVDTEPGVDAPTVVINYGGDEKPFEYDPRETVERLIARAIERFHLTAQPHQLGLFLDGAELPRDQTLEHAHVKPDVHLLLKQIVVEGG
jgi:hypothetical protein